MRYIPRVCRQGSCVVRASLASALVLLSLSSSPAPVRASSEAWHAHADSVLELLQAETRRALDGMVADRPQATSTAPAPAQGRQEPTSPDRVAPDRVAPDRVLPDRVELAALYGTAGRYTAVVYVNGMRKEYRPGATLPYAGGGAAREYRLIRIVDSCVLLKRQNARQTRSACFNPPRQPDAVPPHSDHRVLAAGEAASLNMPLPEPGIAGSGR